MNSHLFIILSLLCAASWAGDVQVDANGNLIVESGAVRAANVLQLPLPTMTIGAAVTLDATAFGKWHLVGGTSGNYDITLPPAANNAGKCLGFRVLDASVASKIYTLKPSTVSEKIDGSADQALTASGSLAIMSDGSHWARIGGTSTGSASSGTSTAALTDWQDAGPIVMSATTTNPTKGTIVRDRSWYRRVGDTMEVRIEYEQSTAGTTGSGDYLLAIPAGLSVDLSKIAANAAAPPAQLTTDVGTWNVSVAAYSGITGTVSVYDATRVRFYGINTNSSAANGDRWCDASAARNFAAATLKFSAEFRVPIAGWSGSQVVQSGSRFLWAQRYAASATRVSTIPNSPGQYRARRLGIDTTPTTLPSANNGLRISKGNGISAGSINLWDIYIGPAKVVQPMFYLSDGRTGFVWANMLVNGGTTDSYNGVLYNYDPVTGVATMWCLDSTVNAGINSAGAGVAEIRFDWMVADDPVPVAQAPTVHVEASSDAGQSVTPHATDMQWEDEAYDSHSAWSGSVFVAPVAGVYLVCVAIGDTTAQATPALWKNGSLYATGTYNYATSQVATITTSVRLAAGENIRIRSANAFTRSATATNNWLRITRIGD